MVYWERHWNRSQRPRFLLWFCSLTLRKAVISPNLRFFLESENLVLSMAVGVFERFTQTRDVCVFIVCLLTLSDSWYPARLYHSPLLPGSVSGLTLVKCSIILPLHVATGVSVYKAHGQWRLGFPEVSPDCIHSLFPRTLKTLHHCPLLPTPTSLPLQVSIHPLNPSKDGLLVSYVSPLRGLSYPSSFLVTF